MLLPPRAGSAPPPPKSLYTKSQQCRWERILRGCAPASPGAETPQHIPGQQGLCPTQTPQISLCWAPQKGIFPNAQPQFPGCSSSFPSSGSPGKSWALSHLELPHKWLWAGVGPLQPPFLPTDPAQPFLLCWDPSATQRRAQGPIPWPMSLSYTSLWVQHSQDGATNTRDFPGCAEPTQTQPRADDERVQTDLGSN